MGRLDHTGNTINLVPTAKDAAFRIIECGIFVKNLSDGSTTAHRVIFAKNVAQITQQQGRYTVGHWCSPFETVALIYERGAQAFLPVLSLIRAHPRKSAVRCFVSQVYSVRYVLGSVPLMPWGYPPPHFLPTPPEIKGLAPSGPWVALGPPKPHPMPGGFLWNQKPAANGQKPILKFSNTATCASPETSTCLVPRK